MINVSTAVVLQLITMAVSIVSSYALLNYRVKQLEQHNADNKDVRDRLIVIETLVRELKKD